MTGRKIFHYVIREKLGQGGMGVVYKAEDTRLGRFVALKFLPSQIQATPEIKTRFIQEAKAAAVLNHPNITTIHAIEETEDEIFIVMEYINGIQLKDKLKAGPIPVSDTIEIAIQIAEGLKAAHEKDIIHRDIKSQNIIVMKDGTAKIMDFGLAKMKGGIQMTKFGIAVGTISYMSPEQARGAKVDKRTDIWSFGVVLYEMFTGELPFKGDYDQAVVYSIMHQKLKFLRKYFTKRSSGLNRIISRCLEKKPDWRYQNFTDVINDLSHLQRKTSGTGVIVKRGLSKRSKTESSRILPDHFRKIKSVLSKEGTIKIAGVILLIVSIILIARWILNPSLPALNPGMSKSVIQPPVSDFYYAGISPGGSMLAVPGSDINGNWSIYLMDTNTGESRKLKTETPSVKITQNTSRAIFSPDGSSIAFGAVNPKTKVEEVCKISILGGYVKVLADTGIVLTWNHKGNRIIYFRGIPDAPSASGWREYHSINADGTGPRLEFIDSLIQGADNSFALSLSPDDSREAFTRSFKGDFNEIIIRNIISGEEKKLTNDHKNIEDIVWLKNGYILFNSNRRGNSNLWLIPDNGGKSVQLTNEAYHDFGMAADESSNHIIYKEVSRVGTLWEVNADGSDNHQVFADVNIWDASFSPDNKKTALLITDQYKMGKSLVIKNLDDGHVETILPFDSLYKVWPRWSPEGDYISYQEFPKAPSVSIPKIKIVDLSHGNKTLDFGYGFLERWLNDSLAVIQLISGPGLVDYKHLGGRGNENKSDSARNKLTSSMRYLNVHTGAEQKVFRENVTFAVPVLNGTKIIYQSSDKKVYIVSKKELADDSSARGELLFRNHKIEKEIIGYPVLSDKWMFFKTTNTIWRMDLKTQKFYKVLDMKDKTRFSLCRFGYNYDSVSYILTETKNNLIKMDNVFLN